MFNLYKTPECSVCVELMDLLDKVNVPYRVHNVEDPKILAELRIELGYVMRVPILEDEGRWLLPEAMVLPGNRLFKQAVVDFLNASED